MNQTILLVEDNPDIIKINRYALTMRGYRVLEARTIEQGRELLERENPNLIILDILLPDGSGLSLCEEIRKNSGLPILFLSALGENQNIVDGLLRGGDDYLPKPYDLDVLLARVEALLRRVVCGTEVIVRRGALTLDTVSQCAMVNGRDILLTPKEFAILLYFVRNEGREVKAEQLYKAAWRQPMKNDTRAVKTAVSRMRKKLEPTGMQITFERGAGYRFKKTFKMPISSLNKGNNTPL